MTTHYKYPNYGYGGMPYYPPYPYRPAYGNGYYPSNWLPPARIWRPLQTLAIFVNNGNRRSTAARTTGTATKNGRGTGLRAAAVQPQPHLERPITAARPNRPELNELNKRQPRPMPADVKRPSTTRRSSTGKAREATRVRSRRPTGRGVQGGGAAGPQARPRQVGFATPGAPPKVQAATRRADARAAGQRSTGSRIARPQHQSACTGRRRHIRRRHRATAAAEAAKGRSRLSQPRASTHPQARVPRHRRNLRSRSVQSAPRTVVVTPRPCPAPTRAARTARRASAGSRACRRARTARAVASSRIGAETGSTTS